MDTQFIEIYRSLDANFKNLTGQLFGKTNNSPKIRLQYSGCSKDILNITHLLRKQFILVVQSYDSYQKACAENKNQEFATFEYHAQLCFEFATLVKAQMFFIRSHNDLMYKFILHFTVPTDDKSKLTMSSISKEKNPVRIWLENNLPGYYEWFAKFLEMRNEIKSGRNHGITYSKEGINVDIHRIKLNENVTEPEYRLSVADILKNLEWTNTITEKLNEKLKPLPLLAK